MIWTIWRWMFDCLYICTYAERKWVITLVMPRAQNKKHNRSRANHLQWNNTLSSTTIYNGLLPCNAQKQKYHEIVFFPTYFILLCKIWPTIFHYFYSWHFSYFSIVHFFSLFFCCTKCDQPCFHYFYFWRPGDILSSWWAEQLVEWMNRSYHFFYSNWYQ